MGNGKNDQFLGLVTVNNRERKAFGKDATGPHLPRRDPSRVRRCQDYCCLDTLAEAFPEPLLLRLVVRDLFEKLDLRFREEANGFTA